MSLLDDLLAPTPQPKYPSGYVKPPKPKISQITERAESAKIAHQPWLDIIADTLNRIDFLTSGYLDEKDLEARNRMMQVGAKSSKLVDDWNALVSYLAGIDVNYEKCVYHPDEYQAAQQIEDFAYYLRREHELNWVERGNIVLRQAEAKDLTLYGTLVSRRLLDLTNEECPFDAALIDPATVFPVWGRTGRRKTLEAVYRVYRTSVYSLLADFTEDGDLPKRITDQIKDQIGTFGETSMVDVVEYWDSWWSSVSILDGIEVKPITAHEYGCVPFIIQYGPGGRPLHTRNPAASYRDEFDYSGGGNADHERTHQAQGFITDAMKQMHDEREGVKTRLMDGFKLGVNQPVILKRTQAMADAELPEIDRTPGGVTEIAAGEEELLPFPTSPPQVETSLLMQMIGTDAQNNGLAPEFQGQLDRSNISGTAQSSAAERQMQQLQGWVQALESYHSRCARHDITLWRNFGHLSRYAGGTKKSFYIPRRNPAQGEAAAYELTPEIVDKVGPKVDAVMNSLSLSQMIPFANAAKMFNELGIWDKRTIAKKAGVTDYDRIEANIRTENAISAAMSLPEFLKVAVVPQGFLAALKAAEGDADKEAALAEMYATWMELVATPQRAQMTGMGMGGPPPQGGPGQGIAGGGGAPYAALGQGPGTQTGVQGGPQGPVGPTGDQSLQGNPMAGM